MDDGRQQQQDAPPPARRPGRRADPQARQAHGRGGGRSRQQQQPAGGRGGRRQQESGAGAAHAATARPAAAVMSPPPNLAALPMGELLSVAEDVRQPAASRAAALQHLHQRLFDPAAQREALQQLQTLWPRLLGLLCEDAAPAVTAAAAPAVGAIGALAAQAAAASAAAREGAGVSAAGAAASRSSGSAGGLLFEWLLPVMQRGATPGGRPLVPHQLAAVLLALRDCLAGVDAVTLARYSNAVLGAAQGLLEGEQTPPPALLPLLAVLQAAARHQHSLKARFTDLADLLLGWALEPALPDAARPALSRTLAAFAAQWRQQPAFTASLLGSLLADVQRLAAKAAAEAAGDAAGATLKQVLALAACVLPILDAAAAARLPGCQQHLLQLLGAFQQAVTAAAAADSAAAPTAAVAAELAGHVGRLAALAPAAAASPPASQSAQAEDEQQPQSASAESPRVAVQLLVSGMVGLSLHEERVRLQLSVDEGPAGSTTTRSLAQAAEHLGQLFAAVAAFAAGATGEADVLAQPATVLALLAALCSWVQMLQAQGVQLDGAAELLLPGASDSSGGGAGSAASWLLALRSYASREVVQQAAQLLLFLLQHSRSALDAVLADSAQLAADGSSEPAAAAALSFNLRLLQAAVPQLPPAQLASLLQQLLPHAEPAGAFAPRLLQSLLQLLQAAAQRLATCREPAAAATLDQVLPLCAAILGSAGESPPEAVTLLALEWLQQAAAWPASVISEGRLAAPLSAALACAEAQSAAVRAAALAAARAWVGSEHGSRLLLRDAAAAAALYQAALLHLSDAELAVAAAARELLAAAAAPLALAGSLGATGGSSSSSSCASSAVLAEAAAAALQPQRLGFTPAQLQRLLRHLTDASGPAAVLTGSGEQSPPALRQWLPRLLCSMQAVAPPGDSEPTAAAGSWRLPSSLSLAAWWAVQEAAKQCVAARLRTHHGGPAQTLMALERALLTAVGQLQAAPGDAPAAAGDERRQAATLLLLFLHALEQGMTAATHGSASGRAAAPQAAVAFFAANAKVCQAWCARVRPALVRTAAAAHLPELAAHYALLRLQDLHQQLQPLLQQAAAASAKATEEEGAEAAGEAAASNDAAAVPAQATPLPLGKQQRRISGSAALGGAANPAAALLAATRGSPDVTQRAAEPGSPAKGPALTQRQVQQAAAKVAEAAAAAAAALCTLGDVESLAGLQAHCRSSFQHLLECVHTMRQGTLAAAAARPGDVAAAAGGAWDWLGAVQLQAAGRYEAALEQYARVCGPGASASGGMQCAPPTALAGFVAEAYAGVGDSVGLQAWLQTGLGGRLPSAAAARCQQLASWDPSTPRQLQGGVESRRPLQQLQLTSLDPAACAKCGSASLAAAASLLASLAAKDGGEGRLQRRMRLQAQLPPELLLGQAAGGHGRRQQLSAWHPAEEEGPAAALGSALEPLLCLLGDAPLAEEQRPALLLAAAPAAASGGNCSSTLRLVASAEAALEAGSSSSRAATADLHLLARLGHLQATAAACDGGSGSSSSSSSSQALQLLLAAKAASPVAAASTAPAAAQLLLSQLRQEHQQPFGLTASEIASLSEAAAALPGLTGVSASSMAALGSGGEPASLQLNVLKAAIAAAPGSADQWWRLASWLDQQRRPASDGSVWSAAAFTAGCHALALGSGSGYSSLPALLMLLRLIVQQGSSSGESLPGDAAAQLATVPAAAWLPLVPQLLAHLASSRDDASSAGDSSQQLLLLALLRQVGSAAPAQVLLSALAAAEPAAGQEGPLQRRLVGELQQQHPQLALQLRVLATEAARLAVLPEEHWSSVLQEAAATAAKRLMAQRKQAAAAGEAPGNDADTGSSSSSSYLAAMAPMLLPLQQQLAAAEAAAAETPHERRFQQAHLPRLRALLAELAEPPSDADDGAAADKPHQARPVLLLRAAAGELGAALRRMKQLSLADVAPALAALADTDIPMPGAALGVDGEAVTLAGVAPQATVLSTKTRPKKLRFAGSDGAQHAYLLKGREDLRADARLMQFLRACHSALQAPGGGGSRRHPSGPAVHCFEVAPLGSRVGLVQWVEGTVPIYELFTSWQQHRAQRQRLLAAAAAQQAQAQQAQAQRQAQQQQALKQQQQMPGARPQVLTVSRTAAGLVRTVRAPLERTAAAAAAAAAGKAAAAQQLRPVELFYAKLREAGIDPATPRDAWPVAKLVRVLQGMQATVDRQLLARELWLGASGAADWWRRQAAFAASAAAMSMVGHLLGLGDRHLDNLLLHRTGGHLLHIDFNVAFDRGAQLKVPEVVPFRLTPALVAALGVTGVEGRFRRGCERTLRALRANAPTLAALLESGLRDSAVDWDIEASSKAAARAFSRAVALQAFALRQATDAPALAGAAAAAGASLAAAAAALGAFVRQFLGVAGTAASAAESHALLQRCQATLASAEEEERALAAAAGEGCAALDAVLAETQPLAAEVQAALHECQAWQQRHDALLPLLLNSPPAAVLMGPAALDTSGAPPLLLVSAPAAGDGAAADDGTGSVLHAALGMPPSQAPLSANLLLQAAAADAQGQRLLQERAAAGARVATALQQYAAAAACLLGGQPYAASSQHAHWAAAFQAAMDLPMPEGFQRAAELAPRQGSADAALSAWRPLAAAAAAAAGLAEQLSSTASALHLERVDVALAAADSRQRMLDGAAASWERLPAAVALAFAAFTDEQAAAVQELAAAAEQQREQHEGGAGGEAAAAGGASLLLEGVQRLVLGYASVAVATRDVTSEALFAAPDGGSQLDWLSLAVQAADGVSTAAAELQLLLPQLMALLHTPAVAAEVSSAVAEASEQLEAAAAGSDEQAAAAAMQPLLAAAAQHPAVSALLQSLQRALAAAQVLVPAEQQPSISQEQLLLAGAVVAAWQELEEAAADSQEEELSPGAAADAADAAWRACSAALATAAAAEVSQHLLPWLASGLATTAQQLRGAAPSLARRAGLESPAAAAGAREAAAAAAAVAAGGVLSELVPFTDFEEGLPGSDMLLGGLEDELEPLEPAAGGSGDSSGSDGGATPAATPRRAPAEPGLVPFLDFDEGLEGADDLLESLEPSADPAEFGGGSGGLSQQDGDSSAAAAPNLSAVLAAAAEASGVLAAVDAVQYVGGLALAQAQQLRQQHCADLAAFQWANEHQLGPEAAAAAEAILQSGATLSATAMAAAGASLPRLHPAVGGWAMRGGRHSVLAELRAGVGALLSLEAPLAAWQQQLAAAGQELSLEAAAAAPWAAADLEQRLRGQQAWLQAASAHAANLQEVAQAVLQLEAARAAGTPEAAAAAAAAVDEEQAQQEHAADRYAAAQHEGWQRYTRLVEDMQALHARHVAADHAVAAATSELAQLELRRREATTIAQSAEAAGSNAAATFAALALPLVKATQQLPPAVATLLPQLAGASGWAEQLRQAQQQAAELAASTAGEAGGAPQGAAATAAAEQLAAAAACVAELPEAVQALQAALLPTRNRLLAGGRGEAAARQQAAQIIDALSPAVTQLGPQLEQLAATQQALAALPSSLQALAQQTAGEAAALQARHGFSLQGLEQLLGVPASGQATPAPSGTAGGGALTGSLLLLAGPGGGSADKRRRYAAGVLQSFAAKLEGQAALPGSGEARPSVAAAADGVEAQVARLIAAATSPERLARMYEGWMPWV